ncbi:MAG: M24 family metallopeptidase, partial [Clostridia bacterium]|nr:M24 family metallopeptidase [Clostridia bacterium]
MIQLKNAAQIEKMKAAGRITGEALLLAGEAIKEGVTTKHLDDIIRSYIEKCGAKPTFLGYGGFPGSACISVNDQVIHGIPSADVILKEGDIVKIDVGATFHGFVGDSANTFGVGKITNEAQELIDCTKE